MEFTIWYYGEFGLGRLVKKAKDLDTLMSRLPKYVKHGLQWIEDKHETIVWEVETPQ